MPYCPDGAINTAGLVQANNGDLYGITFRGGVNDGGTIFKMTPDGLLTTLYSFCAQTECTDGSNPSGLIQATDGNFYGTTGGGGANCAPYGCGTIFKITPHGMLTTLHSFDGTDGNFPAAALVQATDGNFYGTTDAGGINNDGTVFGLSVGLPAFVETQTSAGRVGAHVTVLGTNLIGATSVTFGGIAAVFTVNHSGTAISTSVPVGAATGIVQVVTPGGTLSSNVPFRVLP